MGLTGFLVLCFLQSIASSSIAGISETLSEFHGIYLDIYHVHGPQSSPGPESPVSFSDILTHDEERVKILNFKIGNLNSSQELGGAHVLGTESISIPLNPGTSIGSGNYYVKLGLGSPAKYYSFIFDTGSSFSWIQCQPCAVSCYSQAEPVFSPSQSKTHKTLSCATSQCSLLKSATLNDPVCDASNVCLYTASYGDQSYSVGYLSQDLLTLSPASNLAGFIYGCGQDNQGLFGRAAGIVGLARDMLSMLAQLAPKYGYAFSYCLPTAGSSSTGVLSIGSSSQATSAYKFTPMLTNSQNPSLYFLNIVGITVSGMPLAVDATEYKVPTIIDSGTVITRLPASVYAALKGAFVDIMSNKYAQAPSFSILNACFKGNLYSMSVPAIQMIFQGGAALDLQSSNVVIEIEKGTVCLAFTSSDQVAIIGNRQQQTFKVAYDISNARIGFSASGCH